jgi:RimJ/RimL family protein N-acetyltransferase
VTRNETTSASVLIGRGVVLRPPRESDKADRLAVGRHAEYVRLDGGNTRDLAPLTEDDVAQWYERISSAQYGWVIDIGGRAVGTTRLKNHDAENRSADFAIGIADPALWGRGYGTTITRLVLRFGFETLSLHRVSLIVLDENPRAQAAYAKCGFTREGVLRDTVLIDGVWHSDVAMGILEDEYRRLVVTWEF